MRKLLVVAALLAGTSHIVSTSAPKPNYTLADSVSFRDAPEQPGVNGSGDGIHSDDPIGHTYVNGTGGIEIKIFTGGSGDLTLNVGGTRPARTILADTTSTRLLLPLGNPYPLMTTVCGFLNVNDVWRMSVGEVAARSAIYSHSSGYIHFGEYKANGAGTYSVPVSVTRLSATTWLATTDGTTAQSVYSTTIKGRTAFTAEYTLPFQLTATCSRCANVH